MLQKYVTIIKFRLLGYFLVQQGNSEILQMGGDLQKRITQTAVKSNASIARSPTIERCHRS